MYIYTYIYVYMYICVHKATDIFKKLLTFLKSY